MEDRRRRAKRKHHFKTVRLRHRLAALPDEYETPVANTAIPTVADARACAAKATAAPADQAKIDTAALAKVKETVEFCEARIIEDKL